MPSISPALLAYAALHRTGQAEPVVQSINLPGSRDIILARAKGIPPPDDQVIDRRETAIQCDNASVASVASSQATVNSLKVCSFLLLVVFALLLFAVFASFLISHHAR